MTRKFAYLPTIAALLLLVGSGSGRAATTHDVRGEWDFTCGICGAQTDTFDTQDVDGHVTGHGGGPNPGDYTWTITGDVSGDQITYVVAYNEISYTSTATGTINSDTTVITGTFTDSAGHTDIPFTMNRLSGPPSGGTPPPPSSSPPPEGPPPPTTNRRKSATQANCDWFPLSGTFTCTAQVSDASGSVAPTAPTGNVTFLLDPGTGGAFPAGNTCVLQRSQTGGPTGFCSVTYQPPAPLPAGTQPALTAYYHGDFTFADSSGRPANVFVSATPDDGEVVIPSTLGGNCRRSLRQKGKSCGIYGQQVGQVYEIKDGEAYVRHWDGSYEQLKKGSPLYVGDKVITDTRAVAAFELLIGGRVAVKKGSAVMLINEGEARNGDNSKIGLEKGGMWAKFKDKNNPLTIQTRGGVMGIKG